MLNFSGTGINHYPSSYSAHLSHSSHTSHSSHLLCNTESLLNKKWLLHISLFFLFPFFSFAQSINLSGSAYEKHTDLSWNAYAPADRYEVWRKGPGEKNYSRIATLHELNLLDWTDHTAQGDQTYQYYIHALNVPGTLIQTSDTLTLVESIMSDESFLDMTQEYTLRYFYDYGHPVSGMARERLNSEDVVTTGGSGFGIMALLVGIHRGWITREEGANRLLKMVSFLQIADRFHGAFPHWMNGKTGRVIPFGTLDNGGDLVETAFLMEGLLTARAFFDQDEAKENVIRQVITSLWEDVEWDWYSKNNSGVLYWHWSPDYAWQMNFPIRGYNEALIVYLLAIASPTHKVNASYYHNGWAGSNYINGNSWYGHKLFVGPHFGGPLFFAHYSFMGFDPRGKKDAYTNYFNQNKNHTLINRSWCIANPLHFEGYDENTWGLTASDDPWGYEAHAPGNQTDNGTLTPAAGIPSMPYTPTESIALLKDLYRSYGDQLWGPYGFYDAFNPEENWFADSYLAIDQGPIINMIENYRSGLLWNAFMSNPEIQPALDAIGFVPDVIVGTDDHEHLNMSWSVYPTITAGTVNFKLPTDPNHYTATLTDMVGHVLPYNFLLTESKEVAFPVELKGWIWVSLSSEHRNLGSIPVYMR